MPPPGSEADEALARRRGVLHPGRLPQFIRLSPPQEVIDSVRWFWISRWFLEPGRLSRQEILAFGASNLVVSSQASGGTRLLAVELAGPTTRVSHRELRGQGWAIGALLRPAAAPTFGAPRETRDRNLIVHHPDLVEGVSARLEGAPQAPDAAASDIRAAATAFADWLVRQLPPPTDEALLANRMTELIEADPGITQVPEVAARLGTSVRTVQRLAERYVGLSPAALIRRRRLQSAAELVREHPATPLAQVAEDFGYSDQAHLTRDFSDQLGFTPGQYRTAHQETE